MTPSRITTALCVIVLCGILAAGLTPFHVPRNAVSWLPDGNGLRFERFGSVTGAGSIPDGPGRNCSLEIWLQPLANKTSSTILAFYTPQTPQRFQLIQTDDDLLLTGNALGGSGGGANPGRIVWITIEQAFRLNQPILITMTSGARMSIYLNGTLAKTTDFRFLRSNFVGDLVLGTAAVYHEGWTGCLRGLALYDEELRLEQVARHYRSWTDGKPAVDGASHFYAFGERAGNVVHDAGNPAVNLDVPSRYTIPHRFFLEPPWVAFRNSWSYWKDVLVNIGGFIPFGFLFGVYFSSVKPVRRPVLTTILFAALVTLFIESTQAWLPTRDSSMTDVITNILGTVIGAALQSLKALRSLYDWVLNLSL